MEEKKKASFYRVYKGLMMGFDLPQAVFMVYMSDLMAKRNLGYDTVCSREAHMARLGIRIKTFNKCVALSERMGLLERIPVRGRYDYVFDTEAYGRLVEIVSSTNSYAALRTFCDKVFVSEGRTVRSVTDRELEILRQSFAPYR